VCHRLPGNNRPRMLRGLVVTASCAAPRPEPCALWPRAHQVAPVSAGTQFPHPRCPCSIQMSRHNPKRKRPSIFPCWPTSSALVLALSFRASGYHSQRDRFRGRAARTGSKPRRHRRLQELCSHISGECRRGRVGRAADLPRGGGFQNRRQRHGCLWRSTLQFRRGR
jgi:hypothetical protein